VDGEEYKSRGQVVGRNNASVVGFGDVALHAGSRSALGPGCGKGSRAGGARGSQNRAVGMTVARGAAEQGRPTGLRRFSSTPPLRTTPALMDPGGRRLIVRWVRRRGGCLPSLPSSACEGGGGIRGRWKPGGGSETRPIWGGRDGYVQMARGSRPNLGRGCTCDSVQTAQRDGGSGGRTAHTAPRSNANTVGPAGG